jgi:uncharacterized protein (DUF2345 family)
MEGAPIPFEPYWIKLPDGTVHEGRLDAYGRVRFDDILPGEALIRWPALDEEAAVLTQPAARPPATAPAAAPPTEAPRTWIEAALVDMDGQPMPGERYRITLPDGTAHEGRLDAYGRVRLDQIVAGEAVIVWPDLDAEAVAEMGA